MTHLHRSPGLALLLALAPLWPRPAAADAALAQRLFAHPAGAPPLLERAAPALSTAPAVATARALDLVWWMNEPGQYDGWDLAQAFLIPGLDQAQRGQWLKAGLLVAVEAGTLLGSQALRREGRDLDGKFKAFADAHWDYRRYVDYRQHPGEFGGGSEESNEGFLDRNIDPDWLAHPADHGGIDSLFFGSATANDEYDASGGQGSHPLPGHYLGVNPNGDPWAVGQNGAWYHFIVDRTQQFYEMIGKYAEFQRGWDGYGADNGLEFPAQQAWSAHEFCAQSQRYMAMRTDSNDKLIAADRLLSLIVLNHVASGLDVLLQMRRPGDAPLRVRAAGLETGRGRRPGLSLTWSF
jgi:hypothetical protein